MAMGLTVSSPAETDQVKGKTAKLTSRPLGKTGMQIVPLGFGASRTMEPQLVRAAFDSGINFFDTGRHYFNGRNEIMLREALSGNRKHVIIQSKVRLQIREGSVEEPASADVSRAIKLMTQSLEESLDALGTDYIDIMLIHDASSPKLSHHPSIREFFTAAKKAGKIRAHGFSSHTNHIEMLRAAVRENFFDVVMIPYNHKGSYIHSNSGRHSDWDQPRLETELKKAMDLGIGLIAMKTCSGGPCPPKGGGEPSFQNALRWILERNRVHGLAVAMGNFQQLRENLGALA